MAIDNSDLNPNNDGIDHINIYSKSKNRLGFFLSHFPRTPFEHPEYGNFESMEGFWYYAKTGFKHQYLRGLWGNEAKAFGKKLEIIQNPDFLSIIKSANLAKLNAYRHQYNALIASELPFTHYYVFGDWRMEKGARVWEDNVKVVTPKSGEWLVQFWEETRSILKTISP